jgi:hypothetical protein
MDTLTPLDAGAQANTSTSDATADFHHRLGHPLGLEWLAEQLNRPGYSQAGLAGALGRDPASVSRMLKGERQIKMGEVSTILAYLKLAGPRTIMDEIGDPISGRGPAHDKLDSLGSYILDLEALAISMTALEDSNLAIDDGTLLDAKASLVWMVRRKATELREAFNK